MKELTDYDPAEMIQSVLKQARELDYGALEHADDGGSVGIILLHGDPNNPNALTSTGPFPVASAASHVDEEMLAGAAIVFFEFGDVLVRGGQCYCPPCLDERQD